jgi:tetratricopeptide (TPR) repeat protein
MDKKIVDLCRAGRAAADWFFCRQDSDVEFQGWASERQQSRAIRRVAKAILKDSGGTVTMGEVASLIDCLSGHITNNKIRKLCWAAAYELDCLRDRHIDFPGLEYYGASPPDYCGTSMTESDWYAARFRAKAARRGPAARRTRAIRRVAKAILRDSGGTVTMGDVASLIEYVADVIEEYTGDEEILPPDDIRILNQQAAVMQSSASQAFDEGRSYSANREFDNAITAFTEAIRLDPDNIDAYCNRGYAYSEIGEHDKAIADYTEAIRLGPEALHLCYACFSRGIAYTKKGDYDKAIADCTEAIRLVPDDAVAYRVRGFAYGEKGDLDRAIIDYNEAIRIDPEDVDAHYKRGFAFERNGELDKAIADFTEIIRLKPSYANAYFSRGLFYWKAGELDKAIADLTETIRLDPKIAAAYYFRGSSYRRKGETAEAEADFTQAKELGCTPE